MEFEVPENFTCSRCGAKFMEYISCDLAGDDDLMKVRREYAVCRSCQKAEAERLEAKKLEEAHARKMEELEAGYDKRLKESNLDVYALDYTVGDPRGNADLFRFVEMNQHECLWIAGKTGLCKSRILQYWGRRMLKHTNVQYWPSMDLLSMLSDHAKDIERYLRPIYETELLIIDDLGAECVTEARMKYLFNIIDRRVTGWEQKKRGMIGRRFGCQLWITTNDNGSKLYQNMREYAGPCIRRLQEICKVWEKFD